MINISRGSFTFSLFSFIFYKIFFHFLPLWIKKSIVCIIVVFIRYDNMNQGIKDILSYKSLFLLLQLQSFDLFISVLYHFPSILSLPFFLTHWWFWKFCKWFIFHSFSNYFFLGCLPIQSFLSRSAISKVQIHFLSIIFNKIILFPNNFSFVIGFFCIHPFLVLSFDSFLVFLIMNPDIVFYSFHYNLFVKILLCLCRRLVRIMLKLDSLSDAIHLKGLQSIFETFDLLVSERLMKFVLFFLHETLQLMIFFHSCLFYLLCFHPDIKYFPLVFFGELVISSCLVDFIESMLLNNSSVLLQLSSTIL